MKNSRNHRKMQKKNYICKEKFEHAKDKKYYKFRDHCHYREKYRDDVHKICNLR